MAGGAARTGSPWVYSRALRVLRMKGAETFLGTAAYFLRDLSRCSSYRPHLEEFGCTPNESWPVHAGRAPSGWPKAPVGRGGP